ncbi:hypothetical protein M9H77_04873 [Catharanthus roseus]|uniref:Uncharacterized protein n=1 Tax=Catharanthus roseus TaxID=4058 RepID=A0ACC0CFE4_CATRO|nr:hypothetical protein M9H77_04873 [Catharanthus roseus]
MENFEETNIMPFADVEEFNCDVINYSECIGDDSMLLECLEEEVILKGFRMLKDKIAYEFGHYYVDDSDNEVGSSKMKDPIGRHAKREHTIRNKSIVEIKCNQIRGKRKSALTYASRIKTAVQLSMINGVLGRDLNFTSSECDISLGTSSCDNVEP